MEFAAMLCDGDDNCLWRRDDERVVAAMAARMLWQPAFAVD